MVPDPQNGASSAPQKTKKRKLKGLPVVKVTSTCHPKDIIVHLHGLVEITYEQFCWFFFFLGFSFGIPPIYIAITSENFGNNFEYICAILIFSVVVEVANMVIVRAYGTMARYTTASYMIIIMSAIYALVYPYCELDPVLLMCIGVWRDGVFALGADLARMYMWPNNLHNRKRVENLDQIIAFQGWSLWFWSFKTPFARALMDYFGAKHFVTADPTSWTWLLVCVFPLKVLLFEVINDFMYYWMHRGLHANVWIYQQVHKLHHQSKCPTGFNASTMTLTETLLTFGLSTLVTPWIFVNYFGITWSVTEWAILGMYITGIEVNGHAGHISEVADQGVWRLGTGPILNLLGIRLDCKDHELHHWDLKINFAKRLKIWDIMFNSFEVTKRETAARVALDLDGKED